MDLGREHAPLRGQFAASFDRILGSSAFVLGEEVESFEAEFADYCGASHCVGLASGTAALTIMLRAAGIGPGDEVIVPAHTFVATALAVVHAGARPVAVDVEPSTGLIDPEAVAAAIGPSTAAVLAVHLYGQVCDVDKLHQLTERHGLMLLEDAAQAHGACHRGRRAGTLGAAGAFSFYPSKNLGALGDGGAVCTDDAVLAARMRRYRDLGRDSDQEHAIAGYNERLDGLQAAMLRVKLPHLDEWNAARRRHAATYRLLLGDDPGLELLDERPESPCIYHVFPVRVDDRDHYVRALAAKGITTGVHYSRALPDQPALSMLKSAEVPVARDWAAREVSLPLFATMTNSEVLLVAQALGDISKQAELSHVVEGGGRR